MAVTPIHKASGPRPRLNARVVPELSLWSQYQRIGGSLTPQQVSLIMREADTGDMRRLMDLANDARQKDCTLQAVLAQSEESIAGLDWQLELPENAKLKEKKARDWADEWLRGNAEFARLIAHQAGAVFYSYAVSEIIWTKEAGRLVPGDFVAIAPRRFGYRQSDGRFVLRDETGSMAGVDFIEEFPGKFVVSRPRVNGDIPSREGLVRPLMWAALFRNWDMTDWLRTGEIAWKPWRVGTYKRESFANQEEIDGLVNVLDAMSSNGTAVVPDSLEIDVKWAPNASAKSSHAELFAVIAQEMAKAVLGQTETMSASQSSGYAQAKVHNEVRKDLRESRARAVAHDLTRDVLEPMIRMNFGTTVRVPRLRFVTEDPADLKSFSEAIKNLVDAGAKVPQAWVREEAGIPEPKGDEELLGVQETDDDVGEKEEPKSEAESEDDDEEEEPEG